MFVDPGYVIDELEGQLVAHVLDGSGRLDGSEEPMGVRNVAFLGHSQLLGRVHLAQSGPIWLRAG